MNDLRASMRACAMVGMLVAHLAVLVAPASSEEVGAGSGRPAVPLFDNLGTLHHPMTTKDPLAQRYFDQGMRLVYAFNHEEAVRAFEEAARIDPEAAMAYWGIAYALGPNINAPMDRDAERRAYEAIQHAKARSNAVTPRERAYIDALAHRYGRETGDRPGRDQAYADAMRVVSQRFPDDIDAAVLFAESLMNLHPWDYWTEDGQPKAGTAETLAVLEDALKKAPDHIGACHYYIHTVEAWEPERALPCARRLPDLAPGAGHLVHMPAHIYIRLGMYAEAAERNVHAVSTDREYLKHAGDLHGPYPVGYYPHNIHFLWAALVMQGRSREAVHAARDLTSAVAMEAVRQAPEMEFFVPTPVLSMARFGQWDAILQEPAPPSDLQYSTALWHYARGLALVAQGRLACAEKEGAAVDRIREVIPQGRVVGQTPARVLLGIAGEVLRAHMAAHQQRPEEALRHLRDAIELEGHVRYNEPPDWYYPVRESLGRYLLLLGRPGEAEAVFRQDLTQTPKNPWSLHGLMESLRALDRSDEATKVEAQFQAGWSQADVPFDPSRFDPYRAAKAAAGGDGHPDPCGSVHGAARSSQAAGNMCEGRGPGRSAVQ